MDADTVTAASTSKKKPGQFRMCLRCRDEEAAGADYSNELNRIVVDYRGLQSM